MSDIARVQVVNKALFLMGEEPVTDLSDASLAASIAATKCLRAIEDARDTTLRRHGWTCCLTYQTLQPAVIAGYANFRYPYVYKLPGNALKVWEIDGCAEASWAPRWQSGTEEVGADAQLVIRSTETGALKVCFVRRAVWSALDAHVLDMVGYDLAARAAYSVSGSEALAAKLEARAENKALMAISNDATQEGGQPELAPSIPAQLRNMSR